jgi:DNA-binding IclR family transcriptional regulator
LTRLLRLFDVLAKTADGLSLAELNTALKSPKSSLLNLLRPLVADGFLNYSDGHYALGPAIFRLASSIMSTWNFSQLIRPFVDELARRTGETVYLGVLDRESKAINYVDSIESMHAIRYSVPIGAARPLYCTAAGRLLLAFASPEFQEEYLRTTRFQPCTPRTLTSREALVVELQRIVTTRIATSVGELFPEAADIAAPIVDADGRVVAALAIGGPTERMQPRIAELKPILAEVALRASGIARRIDPGIDKGAAPPKARAAHARPAGR